MRSDHYHRTREAEFSDTHLSGRYWRDLTVAHHKHRRGGTALDERLPARKCAAEIGGCLGCGLIETSGDGASQQIRADDISRAQRAGKKKES